ncbi:MAG: hypothetical protein AVDCRST_MAG93-8889 [uncultured Chloroflexia bacterium]|uniref:Uncharacterized protein n=1 Tax=uncultured Chloroflexia bacterium TaxID=1672391 RepID=A0A6J4N8D2_9CHLR|nr:MAG: hypothetical protein AVDCRST_MAG93-8889 [uncultured Chloroflexia bacterium]
MLRAFRRIARSISSCTLISRGCAPTPVSQGFVANDERALRARPAK